LRNKRFVVVKDIDTGFELYVFRGIERDYLVSPCRMCTCSDFLIHFVWGKRAYPCYHVVGFYIALNEQKYVKLELGHEEVKEIVLEVLFQGFSKLLRKALSKQTT
jgi:predicted nucleic acid-binding Zn finger protein